MSNPALCILCMCRMRDLDLQIAVYAIGLV